MHQFGSGSLPSVCVMEEKTVPRVGCGLCLSPFPQPIHGLVQTQKLGIFGNIGNIFA